MDSKSFTRKLIENSDHSAKEVDLLINGLVEVIKEKCADMDSIAIPGFGTFEPRKRLERINIHPATGKQILIPPKISLTFKMSAVLKQKWREAEESK